MKGYIFGTLRVIDAPGFENEYLPFALAVVEKFGGVFVVSDPAPLMLEGGGTPNRAVVIEFPSHDEARACYQSTEYQDLATRRQFYATANLCLARPR